MTCLSVRRFSSSPHEICFNSFLYFRCEQENLNKLLLYRRETHTQSFAEFFGEISHKQELTEEKQNKAAKDSYFRLCHFIGTTLMYDWQLILSLFTRVTDISSPRSLIGFGTSFRPISIWINVAR